LFTFARADSGTLRSRFEPGVVVARRKSRASGCQEPAEPTLRRMTETMTRQVSTGSPEARCCGASLLRRRHHRVFHLRRLHWRMMAFEEVRNITVEVRAVRRD